MQEKLIRDKLSHVVEQDRIRYCDTGEKKQLLIYKLIEEVQELAASDYTDKMEFADVLEVLAELALEAGHTWDKIEHARRLKYLERGGFAKGVVLKLVDLPTK